MFVFIDDGTRVSQSVIAGYEGLLGLGGDSARFFHESDGRRLFN